MRYLIDAAREYGLDQIVNQALENSHVHGIIVDVHPLWIHYWQKHLMQEDDQHLTDDDYYYRYYLDRYGRLSYAHPGNPVYFNTIVPFELAWYPRFWNNIIKSTNLVVKILLRPGSNTIQLNYEGRLTVVQEHRPVPRMSANAKSIIRPPEGGVSIGYGMNPPGTLGGILNDPVTNDVYGLTCGHVISSTGLSVTQPSLKDDSSASVIGQSVFSHCPVTSGGMLCNPANKTILNEMDVSLIKLDSAIAANKSIINIGTIHGVTKNIQLHPNLGIEFNGRTSDYKTKVLGGIGVTQQLDDPQGNPCCFTHLIEIKEPSITKLVLNRPVQGGDSGSWLIAQGSSGNEWCGMIAGEDRQTGYAIMSESIMDFLQSNGYRLSII